MFGNKRVMKERFFSLYFTLLHVAGDFVLDVISTTMLLKNHINYEHITNQIDYVFDNVDTSDVNKIIFSNGGSMLDKDTFSSTALIYLVYKLNKDHKNVKIISIESRLEYVDKCEL